MPGLIELCNYLEAISLCGEQYNLDCARLAAALRSRPSLTKLACITIPVPYHGIQRMGPQNRRTGASIASLLAAMPHAREIRLDEFRSAHGAEFNQRVSIQLEKLMLDKIVFPPATFLRLLISTAPSELTLSRSLLPSYATISNLLDIIGSRIRSLRIDACQVSSKLTSRRQLIVVFASAGHQDRQHTSVCIAHRPLPRQMPSLEAT